LTASIRRKLNKNSPQLELYEVLADKAAELDPVITEIKDINLDELTPIEAWRKLKDIQDRL
ncbi:MAG: hypothetical protein ACP5F3_08255, partial [Candidatus Syntrophosphaera sp.]